MTNQVLQKLRLSWEITVPTSAVKDVTSAISNVYNNDKPVVSLIDGEEHLQGDV